MKPKAPSLFVFVARGSRDVRCASVLGCHTIAVTGGALRDLRWQGRSVQIHFQTRRFRCRNLQCARKVFAEQLSDVAAPRARETVRLSNVIGWVGYAMGGLPGSRLLGVLGMPSSNDTVLRRVKAPRRGWEEKKVRVLGVDDWAWRKRQSYGTMLMDLEQRQVIDCCPCGPPAVLRIGWESIRRWK